MQEHQLTGSVDLFLIRWVQAKKLQPTLNNSKLVMAAKIYHIELDYILIEKIVMRAVLAIVAYNCAIV